MKTKRVKLTPSEVLATLTERELERGVTLDRWAEARCPDAFAEAKRGSPMLILGAPEPPETVARGALYWEAAGRLREQLETDLDAGLYAV